MSAERKSGFPSLLIPLFHVIDGEAEPSRCLISPSMSLNIELCDGDSITVAFMLLHVMKRMMW
jgi:hypothetical protein